MGEKIGVIGSGGWGICLSILLYKKNCEVIMWEPIREHFEILEKYRESSIYFPGVKIPEGIKITNSLKETVESTNSLIITVRSAFFRTTIRKIEKLYKGQKILIGTKGLEMETGKTVSEIIEEEGIIKKYAILSGPTIAKEIVQGFPAAAVVSSKDKDIASYFQELLSSEILRLYITDDIKGVEIGGAFKNVIAIGAGMIDGLNLGVNTKASYLTRGLNEMIRIGTLLGGKEKTFRGLSGIGDLITTSFSKYSRNRSFGEGIVKVGKDKYLKEHKTVIEGIPATAAFYKLGKKLKVELPITDAIYRIIYLGEKVENEIKNLMKRRLKEE